jgi:hypothetical protein
LVRDLRGDGGVEPRQPFLQVAACKPERLQRRSQRQGEFRVRVIAAPPEGRPQIVDLRLGSVKKLLING